MSINSSFKATAARLLSGVALSALAVGAASAQSIGDEIIVTSQRTEQSLQDVPIAVSAFGGEELDARQMESFTDIQFNIPNFSFSRSNFTNSTIALRGIGALAVGSSTEPAVSVHINDVFIETPRLFETEFFDVERIEILRGPQGTLFGRNATGGVLNVHTNKADPSGVGAHVDAEFGSFDSVKIKGAVNVPLSDTLAARLAGTVIQRDGFTKNVFTGTDIDDRDIYALRGSVRWLPTDNTTIDFMASYMREDDRRQRASGSQCNPDPALGCAPGPLSFGGFGADLRATTFVTSSIDTLTLLGVQAGLPQNIALANASVLGLFQVGAGPVFSQVAQPTDPRKVALDFDPTYNAEESIFMVNLRHDFDQLTFKLNAGYGNSKIAQAQDFDGTVGPELALSPVFSTGFPFGLPANALFPGSPAAPPIAGAPILANTLFAGGTFPTSAFDFVGLAGAIGGKELLRTTNFASANLSIGEGDYWSVEGIVNSDFEGRLNFLLGGNYTERNGFADFSVNVNTLDYFAAVGAVTAVRGATFAGTLDAIAAGTAAAVLAGGGSQAAADAAAAAARTDPANIQTALDNMNAVDGVSGFVPFFFNDTDDAFLESFSIFGEVYFDLTDTIRFTGGVRRNWDDKGVRDRGNFLESILVPGAAVPVVPIGTTDVRPFLDAEEEVVNTPGAINDFRIVQDDFNATTGRAVLEWAATDNANFYVSYTRGYKPGGFNPRPSQNLAAGVPLTFGPENINSIEAGVKSTSHEGRLRANLTGFYYDYGGLQVANFVNQTTVNQNIDATVWGLEGEFVFEPVDDLIFNSTVSYLNTDIGNFQSINSANPAAGVADATVLADITNGTNCVLQANGAPFSLIGFDLGAIDPALAALNSFIDDEFTVCSTLSDLLTTGAGLAPVGLNTIFSGAFATPINFTVTQTGLLTDVTGNELPGSPNVSVSVGAQYSLRLGNNLVATPRIDAYYQGEAFATIFNEAQDRIDDYIIANAQITIGPEDGTWYIRGFVQNLTDKDAVTGLSNLGQTAGNFTNVFLVEPRRYGVGVGMRF
ncbi:MAG: TonB-dependent receptor domain-containing protein [Parvularculaceae bacterium]